MGNQAVRQYAFEEETMAVSPMPQPVPEQPTCAQALPVLALLGSCGCGPGCSCGCQSGGSCQCGGGCG
ncbi:hypothetical protein [Streptomyces kanamyceticus]|uniref:Metallothionein n=1 Tax=Streptomyces kanamyceticus TaxID=1967 RepID=A0A5J6GEF7_STRKN|nr:hypothetical protein [Streptomyces kanamyceticus]QEU93493.1 hypothetical protein CP970_23590 [Streptomyces kanamyceticus]